jgi:2'-hydroxyisoflavone reductase
MRILIMGGTGFIGPHMVNYAIERGHEVTIFTRGNRPAPHPDAEHLIGDRNNDHSALEGREWDVCLDNNCQNYLWAETSTNLLKDVVEHYTFVSSISVYTAQSMGWGNQDRVLWEPEITPDSERYTPEAGWSHGDEAPYGLMKALSEDIVHEAFPGNACIIRPGLIVGPGDRTDRWSYWPVRIAEGGEVLAPGNPDHANQIIDQRDLTEWIVRVAEDRVTGNHNGTGPYGRMSMAQMLYGIRGATTAETTFTWVPEDFLQAQELRPWADLPSWIPGELLMFVDISSAVEAGLTFRSLATTTEDLLEWYHARPEEEKANPRAGMSREREAEVLAAWHRSRG